MYVYIPSVKKSLRDDSGASESYVSISDRKFMDCCEEVLSDIPDTWKEYPDTKTGRMGIVDMEYLELRAVKTNEEMKHELVHLASACLHLWRLLNV